MFFTNKPYCGSEPLGVSMKKKLVVALFLSFVSMSAMANFQLAQNKKAVVCYGEDNMSFNLNAKRSSVKFTVEGESLGAKKITKISTDKSTYASYKTSEGILTLNDSGDSYQFAGEDEAFSVNCY